MATDSSSNPETSTSPDVPSFTNFSESFEHSEYTNIEMPKNFSLLINTLKEFAMGLDPTIGNFSFGRKEIEVALSNGDTDIAESILLGLDEPVTVERAPPPHMTHSGRLYDAEQKEMPHALNDIWIGVILTLLIVFIISFICACFLYHKFQQWKSSYRANRNEPAEMCPRCPPDYEIESLPSYTIVSGLPTYDDALEEFRKAGIILTPKIVPVIKIFECNEAIKSIDSTTDENLDSESNAETASVRSLTCSCGSGGTLPRSVIAQQQTIINLSPPPYSATISPQIIELTPEQLAVLSQKRLSLQIAFNNSMRRPARGGDTLRNNLLRSRAVGNTAGMGPIDSTLPAIHRSASTLSLANEQQLLDQRLQHLHHRGSLY